MRFTELLLAGLLSAVAARGQPQPLNIVLAVDPAHRARLEQLRERFMQLKDLAR